MARLAGVNRAWFCRYWFHWGWRSQRPFKGRCICSDSIFVLASIVELQDGSSGMLWRHLRLEKRGYFMDLLFCFYSNYLQGCQGFGRLALHQGLRRELHHRLRLGRFSCTLKSPTPCQRAGWSNIAFSHILCPQ